jgi:hypothetical protein
VLVRNHLGGVAEHHRQAAVVARQLEPQRQAATTCGLSSMAVVRMRSFDGRTW